MPYKLRKAPNRDLYWVVTIETGKKHSKQPISMEKAKAQMRILESVLFGGMDSSRPSPPTREELDAKREKEDYKKPKLPPSKRREKADKFENNKECPICLEDFEAPYGVKQNVHTGKCGHRTHIDPCYNSIPGEPETPGPGTKLCPLCRMVGYGRCGCRKNRRGRGDDEEDAEMKGLMEQEPAAEMYRPAAPIQRRQNLFEPAPVRRIRKKAIKRKLHEITGFPDIPYGRHEPRAKGKCKTCGKRRGGVWWADMDQETRQQMRDEFNMYKREIEARNISEEEKERLKKLLYDEITTHYKNQWEENQLIEQQNPLHQGQQPRRPPPGKPFNPLSIFPKISKKAVDVACEFGKCLFNPFG